MNTQNKIANGFFIDFEYNGCISISAHYFFIYFEVKSCKSGYSQALTTYCYGVDCTVGSVSCR